LVVKYGSKIFACASSGMPDPVSAMTSGYEVEPKPSALGFAGMDPFGDHEQKMLGGVKRG
jgi:hypothetical protein